MRVARILLASLAVWMCHAQPSVLSVSGDVATPVTFTAAEFAAMPHISITVPEKNGGNAVYQGVRLRDVLGKAGAPFGKPLRGKALASYVLASAKDGYQVTFALAELDPEFQDSDRILVADRRDGKPLAADQGPLRIIAGGDKIPARSIRMLEKLQVVLLRK
jgi:hypothetical protein